MSYPHPNGWFPWRQTAAYAEWHHFMLDRTVLVVRSVEGGFKADGLDDVFTDENAAMRAADATYRANSPLRPT